MRPRRLVPTVRNSRYGIGGLPSGRSSVFVLERDLLTEIHLTGAAG